MENPGLNHISKS